MIKGRNVRLAWAITGAGHFLSETFSLMRQVVRNKRIKVTIFVSKAGEEVVQMYGLSSEVKKIAPGGYYRETFTESMEGASVPHAGRFTRRMYDLLFLSPATSNTVAKIVNGISDDLITNVVAQAQKGEVPVYVVPSDTPTKTFVKTELPYRVERSLCDGSELCVAVCPYSAINMVEGKATINLLRCTGCGLCVSVCPKKAIKHGEKVKIRVREVDAENVKRLSKMEGVVVLRHPRDMLVALESLLEK